MMERFGRGVVMSWRENNIKTEEQEERKKSKMGIRKARFGSASACVRVRKNISWRNKCEWNKILNNPPPLSAWWVPGGGGPGQTIRSVIYFDPPRTGRNVFCHTERTPKYRTSVVLPRSLVTVLVSRLFCRTLKYCILLQEQYIPQLVALSDDLEQNLFTITVALPARYLARHGAVHQDHRGHEDVGAHRQKPSIMYVSPEAAVQKPPPPDYPTFDSHNYLFCGKAQLFGYDYQTPQPTSSREKMSLELVFRKALKEIAEELHEIDPEPLEVSLENPMFISGWYLELRLIKKLRILQGPVQRPRPEQVPHPVVRRQDVSSQAVRGRQPLRGVRAGVARPLRAEFVGRFDQRESRITHHAVVHESVEFIVIFLFRFNVTSISDTANIPPVINFSPHPF
ncbi:hypothetical protein J6590_007517 [Homalodisca vitripennis]|nr:hypothetical protein J6590_007517 [Homalodisca vitripennis]